jgi:hypothetical protein
MAKKRPTPTPGSGRATKSQVARALPTASQVRERDRRRAAQRARSARRAAELASGDDAAPGQPIPKPRPGASTAPEDLPGDRPKGGKPKQEAERLESEIKAWLLASLEPVAGAEQAAKPGPRPTTPAAKSDPAPTTPAATTPAATTEPAPESARERAAESTVTTEPEPGVEEQSGVGADLGFVDEPVAAELTAESGVLADHDLADQPDLADRSDVPASVAASEELQTGDQPTHEDELPPEVTPESVNHAPDAPGLMEPGYRAVQYPPGTWMADVLARGATAEPVGGGRRLLPGWLRPEAERESRRRGLLMGLVVLLITAIALGAIVWRIIGIGHGDGGSSSTDAGSGATPTAVGLKSGVTITSDGGLDGVMQLVLDHPVPSLAVSVLTPAAGTSTADFEPVISQLTLTADGQQIKTVARELRSGDRVKLALPSGARTVELSYRADGVMFRSKPSKAGRALVLLTPMIVRPTNNLYGSINVHSTAVTNVGCSIAGAPLIACGTKTSDGWRVTAPPGQGGVNVLAQINLPAT